VADLIEFGPHIIRKATWKRMLLTIRAYSTEPTPKETKLILLARIIKNRMVIEDFVQTVGNSASDHCRYDIHDIKKIEGEARKDRLIVVGTLHTHPQSKPEPSYKDRESWLALMFEFDRPLSYYIIDPQSLKLACYAIPTQTFIQLKQAIEPVCYKLDD
jgi:proteasome lid subunit RPN8/RPN11